MYVFRDKHVLMAVMFKLMIRFKFTKVEMVMRHWPLTGNANTRFGIHVKVLVTTVYLVVNVEQFCTQDFFYIGSLKVKGEIFFLKP